jgi:hypothetical protein
MTDVQQMEREWVEAIRGSFVQKEIVAVESTTGRIAIVAWGFQNYPEPQYYCAHLNGRQIMHKELAIMNYDEYALIDDMRRADITTPKILQKLTHLLDSDERLLW